LAQSANDCGALRRFRPPDALAPQGGRRSPRRASCGALRAVLTRSGTSKAGWCRPWGRHFSGCGASPALLRQRRWWSAGALAEGTAEGGW